MNWRDHYQGESEPEWLKLSSNCGYFHAPNQEGYLRKWRHCLRAEFPNDNFVHQDVALGCLRAEEYFCFGGELHTVQALPEDAFFRFAEASGSDEDIHALAKEFGPLGLPLANFLFGDYSCQRFQDHWLDSVNQLALQGNIEEASRIREVLQRIEQQPYYKDWLNSKLPNIPAESIETWRNQCAALSDAIGIKRLLDEGFDRSPDWGFPMKIEQERIKDESGKLETPGLVRDWAIFLSQLELRQPDLKTKHPFRAKLYLDFLYFVVNIRLQGVRVYYTPEGHNLVGRSLFAKLWMQAADYIYEDPEHRRCEACGRWMMITGKAKGRGKKTCNDSCRARLSQKKRKKTL